MPVTIVALSDTHGRHAELEVPPGDLLVHAGDFTLHGRLEEAAAFDAWLAGLPQPHKIVVPGNHDLCCERDPAALRAPFRHAIYLVDAGTDLLVTHGPPLSIGNRTAAGDAAGCSDLLDAVRRLRPRAHGFGHIHEGSGLYE